MEKIDIDKDIAQAIDVLRKGGLILYPTDTVWGIGCDASNAQAVKKVFALKRRADSKALITLVADIDMLYRVVDTVPEVAVQLIEVSDRPVTIVYDKGIGVAPELLAADGSIAVRVTNESFSKSLCKRFRRPLVSTSANISSSPTPLSFSQISKEIIDGVDYVCHYAQNDTRQNKPSLIIKISESGEFKFLRK